MEWKAVYGGKIWRVEQTKRSGGKVFEKAVRAPGSRVIIIDSERILLSKEKRHELGGRIDYRLPGGKVFDTAVEYESFLISGADIIEASRDSIAKEALEETGIILEKGLLEYLGKDVLGATCEWDLHYWVSRNFEFHKKGPKHHESEADEIQACEWVDFDRLRKIVLDRQQFSESRSAAMILSYLENL